MAINKTFRNIEHTPSLDDMIERKTSKLVRHLGEKASFDWVCWVEKDDHYSELKVTNGKDHFIAKANSSNLYTTFDLVVDKVLNQISHNR